jgi:hypothetical protein
MKNSMDKKVAGYLALAFLCGALLFSDAPMRIFDSYQNAQKESQVRNERLRQREQNLAYGVAMAQGWECFGDDEECKYQYLATKPSILMKRVLEQSFVRLFVFEGNEDNPLIAYQFAWEADCDMESSYMVDTTVYGTYADVFHNNGQDLGKRPMDCISLSGTRFLVGRLEQPLDSLNQKISDFEQIKFGGFEISPGFSYWPYEKIFQSFMISTSSSGEENKRTNPSVDSCRLTYELLAKSTPLCTKFGY